MSRYAGPADNASGCHTLEQPRGSPARCGLRKAASGWLFGLQPHCTETCD